MNQDDLYEMLQTVHYNYPSETLRYESLSKATKQNVVLSYLLLPEEQFHRYIASEPSTENVYKNRIYNSYALTNKS
jgi:hypothetical protein